MGPFRAASRILILGPSMLFVGALPFGCDRPPNPPESHASQVAVVPQRQELSATPAPSTSTRSSAQAAAGDDGLDEFKQALLYKVDRARSRGSVAHNLPSEPPAAPDGPILHQPEGEGVHAAILVRNADGTVRKECVSSAAEVSALVEEIRKGRTP